MAAVRVYDVLIAGSGPAGLAAALGLSRVHRTAAIFTKTKGAGFRNEGITEMHNVLSRDKANPIEFRKISAEQIKAYGTTDFIEADIVKLRSAKLRINGREWNGFEAEDSTGQVWQGRKLILAMGSVEVFPGIEGYKENWPENIYQCLYCDGHEKSHLPGGVLGFDNMFSPHLVQMANLLRTESSGPVTVFTDGITSDPPGVQNGFATIDALGCKLETAKVLRLVPEHKAGVTVVLEGGREVRVGWLAHKPDTVLAGKEMIDQLGVEYESKPVMGEYVKLASPFGETNVKGVFAAGDSSTPMKAVANAISSGGMAAGGIVQQLMGEDLAFAMETHKKAQGVNGANGAVLA